MTATAPTTRLASWIGIGLPVLSAVWVAAIARSTDVKVAQLQREQQAAELGLQQSQLRDQQEARRATFLAEHVPKMLGENVAERAAAKALLLLMYPNDAVDILDRLTEQASGADSQRLANWRTQAVRVDASTGEWTVVVGGSREEATARAVAEGALASGLAPVSVYRKSGMLRVAVGRYPTRDAAEQGAVAARATFRPDAYVVALGTWCNPDSSTEGQVISCRQR